MFLKGQRNNQKIFHYLFKNIDKVDKFRLGAESWPLSAQGSETEDVVGNGTYEEKIDRRRLNADAYQKGILNIFART